MSRAPLVADEVAAEDRVSPAGGLLRGARRPPGWQPPGPPPRVPQPVPAALWPGRGEDLCWLAGNWRILQRTDGHRFSLDDLVTAYHASTTLETEPARFLDLGTGIGTVLLYSAWRYPAAQGVGIEAQAVSAHLARRSLHWNGVAERCRVVEGDFRDLAVLAAAQPPFPLVTGTPPYFPPGTGVEATAPQRGPCRFERRGGIEAYCAAAATALAAGGRFVACLATPSAAPAERRARVAEAGRAAGLVLVSWRDVVAKQGKAPRLSVFAFGRTVDGVEDLRELPPLVVRDAAGVWTPEFRSVRAAMGMPSPA